MWLYVLAHLFLIVFGFFAGAAAWAVIESSSYGKSETWWLGGLLGLGTGWFIANRLVEGAHALVSKSENRSEGKVVSAWPGLPEAESNGKNLSPCPDCGRMLSRLAATCPQCGRPMTPGGTASP